MNYSSTPIYAFIMHVCRCVLPWIAPLHQELFCRTNNKAEECQDGPLPRTMREVL